MMRGLFVFVLIHLCIAVRGQQPGQPLPPWKEGMLDLHHINTGRGDAAFYILPDGTTVLLDAGEMPPAPSPRRTALHPNDSKRAYEWIALYVKKFMPTVSGGDLDYALITHFHDDHYGGYYPEAPQSKTGQYFLSGITGVGDLVGIKTMIDRGYPDYAHPRQMKLLRTSMDAKTVEVEDGSRAIINYWKFVDYHVKNSGMKAESLKAGRDDQIALVHKAANYPAFKVRNIKSNGTIWAGHGTETFDHFTPYNTSNQISENPLSNVIRIDYGDFRYYTGGDCPSIADLEQPKWNDVGTAIARSVGEVDVAVMDHHGNRDSHNEFNIMILRPRVWVQQTWSADHPGHDVLRRITSQYLYKGPRDLFATNMMEANKIVIGPLVERSYKSMEGHILVRVMPGGKTYHVIILDDNNEDCQVKAVFGPYQTKRKSAQ